MTEKSKNEDNRLDIKISLLVHLERLVELTLAVLTVLIASGGHSRIHAVGGSAVRRWAV